jgi:hypothetical protein
MLKRTWLMVACQIGRSVFPDECIYYLILADGDDQIGTTSREYCYTRAGQRLAVDQPLSGKALGGWVAAKLIRLEEDNSLLVSLPDGAEVWITKDQVRSGKKAPERSTRPRDRGLRWPEAASLQARKPTS